MALTQEVVKNIHADLRAAMAEIAKKHNLTLANSHVSYNDAGFKLTGEFGSKEVMGEVDPKFYRDMQRHGWKFGLSVEDIGKTFVSGAKTYKIEGMVGYTFVVGVAADGKKYKFKAASVKVNK